METISHLLHDPAFIVAISFVIFVGLVLKVGVPSMIAKALDERAEKISKQINDARILREDAQALLAQFQRKQRDAKKEAEEMVAYSIEEAKLFAKEADAHFEASIERQKKSAEDKIAQAEANAIKEVKAAAIEIAIGATQNILESQLGKDKASDLVNSAIKDLEKQIH